MKLRNKKTGEIIEGKCFTDIVNKLHERGDVLCYGSLLNVDLFTEYWKEIDSYEPKEPKLDGEVREIVRHWANLHGYNYLSAVFIKRESERIFSVVSPDATRRIEFSGAYVADDFDAGKYTITELCGEENEED